MIRYRQTLLVCLLILLPGVLMAQNNTNSPYTRYGYGQMADLGSGNSKAMGGIAYGLRDNYQVNSANPASYTSVDSLTFIFDGGISLQNTNFSNGTLKQNAKNSSFDYITMQFRLARWMGMSVGLLPYSNVGYNVSKYRPDPVLEENSTTMQYTGEGGLHQLYLGAGFKLLKSLSVGANISYLWGDLTHVKTVDYPWNSSVFPIINTSSIAVKSYKLDIGAQYSQQLAKKHLLTIGAVFTPGHGLNNEAYEQEQLGDSETGSTVNTRDLPAKMELPMTIGAGLAYIYDKRLTVGADFMWQQWSSVDYMNQQDAFCDRTRISVGAEYLPTLMGRNYFSHVKYRLGGYYSQPYYKIDGGRAAREYGLTAGFGLPIPRTRSMVSVSAQYVKTKGLQASALDENTLRICIGVTFNERWFFKRKVD